jgi:hypothetical protein
MRKETVCEVDNAALLHPAGHDFGYLRPTAAVVVDYIF